MKRIFSLLLIALLMANPTLGEFLGETEMEWGSDFDSEPAFESEAVSFEEAPLEGSAAQDSFFADEQPDSALMEEPVEGDFLAERSDEEEAFEEGFQADFLDRSFDGVAEADEQVGGVDDYPSNWKNVDYNYALNYGITDAYNYYVRQCTSFVAWRLNSRNGVAFHTRYGGAHWGNANSWGAAASSLGIRVDKNPAAGSVYWSNSGTYGHVAWVEEVLGNGQVIIEEYNGNYRNPGTYGRRTVDVGSASGYIHIKDLSNHGAVMEKGYDRVLPDGNYMIASAADPYYFLDIYGGDVPAKNSANVSLWHTGNGWVGANDAWTITYKDGFYTIKQYGTNMALDVVDGSTQEGTNVQVYQSNNQNPQKWAISRNERNGYRLEAKCSGYSLDIADGTLANQTNIRQWSDNDSNAQAWVFIPFNPKQVIENGRYVLLSGMDRSLELDVSGETGNLPNDTNVQIWKDTKCSSKYNSFDVEKVEGGYYTLTHAASGKRLDADGPSTNYGANVHLWDKREGFAQRWGIVPNKDGYMVIARYSGHAMDVADWKKENGTNVIQWGAHGGENQTWYFVRAEYSVSYDAKGGSQAPQRQTKYYMENLTLSKQIPVRSGYIFKGWEGNGTLYQPGASYKADKDVKLVAKWSAAPTNTPRPTNTPTPTSTPRPTNTPTPTPTSTPRPTNTPTPTPTSTPTPTPTSTPAPLPTTAVQYTIVYDLNGGSGNFPMQIKTQGEPVTLSSQSPVREGYTFICWNTSQDGTGLPYGPGEVYVLDENLYLYAIWEKNEATFYTLHFDANGGEGGPPDLQKTKGVSVQLPLEQPIREGYWFTSWNLERDGNGSVYYPGDLFSRDENVTFYAQWRQQEEQTGTISLDREEAILYLNTDQDGLQLNVTVTGFTGYDASDVEFTSSSTKVATVDDDGYVEALRKGKTKVFATLIVEDVEYTDSCTIQVKKPSLSVKKKWTLRVGERISLGAKATPAGEISYRSSNKKVATVDEDGVVTARKKGSCKIVVSCHELSKTVKIKVKK